LTRSDIIALIKETFGFRQTGDDSILRWMQIAQNNLEQAPTKPWFLLSERATIRIGPTTDGDNRLALPSDFLQEPEEECTLQYYPDDDLDEGIELVKRSFADAKAAYEGNTGTPEVYSLSGKYFYIWPYIPEDASYLLGMKYYKKGALVAASNENVWMEHAPFLLIGETGKLMATPLRDKDALTAFAAYSAQGRAQLDNYNEAREHANMSYQVGGPHN
jgi:hypothetical protein